MIEDILGGPPSMIREADVPVLPPVGQIRVPEQPPALMDPQQIRAVDALFSKHDESSMAAGLMGLALGGPALIDMMAEQFRQPAEEEEIRAKKKEPPPQ